MSESTQPNNDDLLTVAELADLLGVPVRTIHAWRYRGTAPPGIRLGKHLRFRRGAVETWIDEHEDR